MLPALTRLCYSLHFRALHTPFSQQGGWLLRHRAVLTTSCKTVVFRCHLVTGSHLTELQMFHGALLRTAASLARSVALSAHVTAAAASRRAAATALVTMHVIGPYIYAL